MNSRLLHRLESDIRGASSHSAADCLRCERAAYLARRGDVEAAARELAAIRQRHGAQRRPSIFAWVNLAEGLVGHHGQRGHEARDKIGRAYALSSAAALSPLRALAAAWLAQLDQSRHDVASLVGHAAEALELAAPNHHGARGRAALVIAQSYDEGGRYDLARPWYRLAHWHVTAEGDNATLSAMLWRMASLRLAAWRQARGTQVDTRCDDDGASPAAESPGRHALASAESAARFAHLTGMRVPLALPPILRAQACTLLGQTDEALPLYESHLAEAIGHGMASIEGMLFADRAWCRARAGRENDARADAAWAAACLALPGAHGDRAPAHDRLADLHESFGQTCAAREQRTIADRHWAAHLEDQHLQVETLDRALAGFSP